MLKSLAATVTTIFGTAGAFALYAAFLLLGLGELYWCWMAIQLGSFLMFVICFFPPVMIITAPVGAYSLIFGMPLWVFRMFA